MGGKDGNIVLEEWKYLGEGNGHMLGMGMCGEGDGNMWVWRGRSHVGVEGKSKCGCGGEGHMGCGGEGHM